MICKSSRTTTWFKTRSKMLYINHIRSTSTSMFFLSLRTKSRTLTTTSPFLPVAASEGKTKPFLQSYPLFPLKILVQSVVYFFKMK